MIKVVQLRGLIVHHHLVIEGNEAFLIDSGFMGGVGRIKRALARHGWDFGNVRALILTHGHLDHTLNIAKLRQLSGCRVFAPREDRSHLEGNYPYRGWGRICGGLELLGRLILRYRKPRVDEWFAPNETVCGFVTVSLPGHTEGHCGILVEEPAILISGDLFARQFRKAQPPPFFLNDDQDQTLESIRKAACLEIAGVSPSHGRKQSPEQCLESLRSLARSLSF